MKKHVFLSSLIAVTLTGCLGSSDDDDDTRIFKLSVTDAPVTDAAKVVIAFDSIELKHTDQTYDFDLTADGETYHAVDLMELQGALDEQLVSAEVAAGEYQWVRLHIVTDAGASYVELEDGSTHELTIPSGYTSGLKLNQGFTMPSFGTADFTLDFDLAKSLVVNGNGEYHLKPVIRMVDNLEAGHIDGSITAALMEQNGCSEAAVYLFDGHDATFDDLGSAAEPLTSTNASYNETDSVYEYEIGFVPFGDYSLHLVCNPVDDPEVDEEISSFAQNNVSVADTGTTTVDFE